MHLHSLQNKAFKFLRIFNELVVRPRYIIHESWEKIVQLEGWKEKHIVVYLDTPNNQLTQLTQLQQHNTILLWHVPVQMHSKERLMLH